VLALVLSGVLAANVAPDEQARQWDLEIASTPEKQYKLTASEAKDIINSNHQDNLPDGIKGQLGHSNNCLAVAIFNKRLFVAWRSSPTHFASKKTKVFLMSAPIDEADKIDPTQDFQWEKELQVQLDRDAREPFFVIVNDTLHFYFFQAGTDPIAFQPNQMWRMRYQGATGSWTTQEPWGQLGEIAWQYQVENGTAYAGSYAGNHYDFFALGNVSLMLNKSTDGVNWEPVQEGQEVTYRGGASEVGWNFDLEGNFWGVLRNEDGDESGWGSRIAHAKAGQLGNWQFASEKSDPTIYESPRMFRHGNDLYLVARTDPTGHFMNHEFWQTILPDWLHHLSDLAWYSLRSHGNALWKVNTTTASLEKLMDIPGCGDTSFSSILRLSKHKYLIANYSSPRD